jgi:hypothetical protein
MAACVPVRYSTSINNAFTEENIMKIRKNFEAVFLAAVAVAALASVATASVPEAAAPKQVTVAAADTSTMQVVEVKHKRLTAEEKAQLN